MNQPRIELINSLIIRCENVRSKWETQELAEILKDLLKALLRNEV